MRIALALAVAVTLAWLLFTAHDKNCHFNVHVKGRLICSERGR